MATWASVAQANKQHKNHTQLIVQYNIPQSKKQQTKVDDIPREREITPHPADDFTMTNGSIHSYDDDIPIVVFPTIVGRPRHQTALVDAVNSNL